MLTALFTKNSHTKILFKRGKIVFVSNIIGEKFIACFVRFFYVRINEWYDKRCN